MAAADSYLASFRPFTGFEGFENVNSNVFTNALGQIPAANAAMATTMARDALAARASLDSTKLQIEQNQKVYDQQNKRNKWATALSLAGAFGGFGSSGSGGGTTVKLPESNMSWMDMMSNMFTLKGQLSQTAMNDTARTRAAGESAAKAIYGGS